MARGVGRQFNVSVAGIPVRASRGWIALAALLTAISTNALAPRQSDGWDLVAWYVAAAIVILGAFGSLLLHELAHHAMARRFSEGLRGIHLPMIGGLDDTAYHPTNPRTEAWVAVAGPIASLLLALVLGAGWRYIFDGRLITGVFGFLSLINLTIAAANMMPGYPLDGGRVFRAFAWYLTDDLITGTRAAATYGQAIGFAGLFAGFMMLAAGEPISIWGAWAMLAFLTLNRAGREGLMRTIWRETGRRITIEEAGLAHSRRVQHDRTIDDAIDELLQSHASGPLLVEREGEIVALTSLPRIRPVPRRLWTERTIADVSRPVDGLHRIDAQAPLLDLIELFESVNPEVVLITRDDRIVAATDRTHTQSRVSEQSRQPGFRQSRLGR